jgi:hypothetical protein
MSLDWTKPVTLALEGPGQYTTIRNTSEASWALVEDWPIEDSPVLDRTLEIFAAVLEGKRPAADARAAFLAAAAEANIHVQE